jgi:hypothetical protein
MSIKDFLDSVKSSRSNSLPAPMQFLRLDTEGMAKRMKLREKAADACKNNLPPTGSTSLDSTEQEIVNEIEGEAKSSFDRYLDLQKTYSSRAADANIQSMVLNIGAATDAAVTDFERKTQVGTSELYPLKREAVETEVELYRFREEEGIKRPARYYGSRTLKYGILALFIGIESIANSFFLAEGSDLGFLGGFVQAIGIAGVNVVVAYLTGRYIAPWVAYRNWFVKFLALIGMVLYVGAAAVINLAVAHFRAASGQFETAKAAQVAMQAVFDTPLALPDFQAWLLLVVGILFSVATVIDAFVMDDPYPGYGQRMRQNLDAFDDYTDTKDALTQELEDIKKDAEEVIDGIARSIEARQGIFSDLVVRSQTLQSSIEEHFTNLDGAANHLLSIYRDENRKCRTDEAPSRFSDQWRYRRPDTNVTVVPEHMRKSLEEAMRAAMVEIPRCRERMYEAYRRAINEYKRIDDLTAKDLRK